MDNEEINARYFEAYAQEKGINLNKAGNIHCINPNHKDDDPSMTYYADSHKLFCHGEHRPYDIFDLVKIYENVADDKEAKKFICDKYNIGDTSYIRDIKNISYKKDVTNTTNIIPFTTPAPAEATKQDSENISKTYDFTANILKLEAQQGEDKIKHFKDRRANRRDNKKVPSMLCK